VPLRPAKELDADTRWLRSQRLKKSRKSAFLCVHLRPIPALDADIRWLRSQMMRTSNKSAFLCVHLRPMQALDAEDAGGLDYAKIGEICVSISKRRDLALNCSQPGKRTNRGAQD
jgi:hypothetical protein